MENTAYCLKCKKQTELIESETFHIRKITMVKGKCGVCKSRTTAIAKKKNTGGTTATKKPSIKVAKVEGVKGEVGGVGLFTNIKFPASDETPGSNGFHF